MSRVSCFSVVPPRSDNDTVDRLNPVTSAMVRRVTRGFALPRPLPLDVILLLIVFAFPHPFLHRWAQKPNRPNFATIYKTH
ncbi:hypothetical protein D9M68_898010 [compost metagenome]